MAGTGALEKPVVTLRVEKPVLVKTRKLKLMIHVGGEYKIILARQKLPEIGIGTPRGGVVAVYKDLAGPPRPVFLGGGIGVEAAGIHIGDPVFPVKVRKKSLKAFAIVGQPRRG